MTAFAAGTPALNLVTQVVNPATSQNPDSFLVTAGSERNGSILVSDAHGRYASPASRGNMFFASSGLAGSVVLLSAATLTTNKFTLWNPAGSGKNMELVSISWQILGGGTEIVTQLGLAFQVGVSTAGVPTTVTAGVINNCLIGRGNASVGVFYTTATLTNAAIGSTFPHFWLVNNPLGTTATSEGRFIDLGGQLVMPPDTIVTPVAAITGTEIEATITLVWAEYPV